MLRLILLQKGVQRPLGSLWLLELTWVAGHVWVLSRETSLGRLLVVGILPELTEIRLLRLVTILLLLGSSVLWSIAAVVRLLSIGLTMSRLAMLRLVLLLVSALIAAVLLVASVV